MIDHDDHDDEKEKAYLHKGAGNDDRMIFLWVYVRKQSETRELMLLDGCKLESQKPNWLPDFLLL